MSVAWKVGDSVKHTVFGEGRVTNLFGSGEKVSIAVKFQGMGPKILDPTSSLIAGAAPATTPKARSSGPQPVWNLDLKPGRHPIREAMNLNMKKGPALFLEDGQAFWLKIRPALLAGVRLRYTEQKGNLFRSPGRAFDLLVKEFDPERWRFVVDLAPREEPAPPPPPPRVEPDLSHLDALLREIEVKAVQVPKAAAAPEPPPPFPVELEPDEDPVRRPDGSWRWRGALFNTREEVMLAKALMAQGAAAVSSNSSMLLQECRKLHRKPDLLVFHNVDGRMICGIAEVDGSSHDGRWVEDQERHQELQRAGFLAVRHYRAEQVFMDPSGAAADFLQFLESFGALGQPAPAHRPSPTLRA